MKLTRASGSSTRLPKGQARKQKDTPSRQRRSAARTVAQIQDKATERQAAWLETEQPITTYRLTRELDALYDEHRDEHAGTLKAPYRGRTWGPR